MNNLVAKTSKWFIYVKNQCANATNSFTASIVIIYPEHYVSYFRNNCFKSASNTFEMKWIFESYYVST